MAFAFSRKHLKIAFFIFWLHIFAWLLFSFFYDTTNIGQSTKKVLEISGDRQNNEEHEQLVTCAGSDCPYPDLYAKPKPVGKILAVFSSKENEDIDQLIGRSNQLKAQKKWQEALDVLEQGLQKYPYSDKISTYKGGWFYDQRNYSEAFVWYARASELNPYDHLYPTNAALCLNLMGKEHQALMFLKKAYEIKPSVGQLVGICDSLWKMNDWTNWKAYTRKIVEDTKAQLKKGETPGVVPYHALHFPFDLRQLYQIGSLHSANIKREALRNNIALTYTQDFSPSRRIRVGYVSYDFRNHAVGIQVQSMFGFHNRSRFEVWAYNVNDGTHDPYNDNIYNKIKREVEHMEDIGGMTTADAAKKINDDKIDILIDLGLFTAYSRMDIFALRPAPVQVAYLGLATTTGADYYDYMVADRFVVPPIGERWYSEKLVFMPHAYHILDHKQYYPTREPIPRRALALPENKFLFCNHANNYRLDPEIFDVWANIVKKSPNSALVLKYYNNVTANNIIKEAKNRGLVYDTNYNVSQILFMHGAGANEHIQRKAQCNLYLDVHKYNGHSTSADILWAGVPMVTYPGVSIAARAAGSFAWAAGFPEMIVYTWQEYEDKAVEMATDSVQYQKLRSAIEQSRSTMPLFDTVRWVKNFEYALEIMFKTIQQGSSRSHIYVQDQYQT